MYDGKTKDWAQTKSWHLCLLLWCLAGFITRSPLVTMVTYVIHSHHSLLTLLHSLLIHSILTHLVLRTIAQSTKYSKKTSIFSVLSRPRLSYVLLTRLMSHDCATQYSKKTSIYGQREVYSGHVHQFSGLAVAVFSLRWHILSRHPQRIKGLVKKDTRESGPEHLKMWWLENKI